MPSPIAFGDRSTFETLCPTCAAERYPLAFPHHTAPDAELERLGEIYAHDMLDHVLSTTWESLLNREVSA
jgi:hypothetical protein